MAAATYLERKRICGMVDVHMYVRTTHNEIVPLCTLVCMGLAQARPNNEQTVAVTLSHTEKTEGLFLPPFGGVRCNVMCNIIHRLSHTLINCA